MSAPGPPLLELSGVTVRREGAVLLEAVSLEVAAGEIHALVGPNGAGKSTLIGALLSQTSFEGRIRLHFRGTGQIGYVPQDFAVDRTLPITVAEFLALSRQRWPVCWGVRPRTRAAISALLGRVGLAGMERRRLGVLSGGELRRVLVANALDPGPELLICDEPASGLDPASVERVDSLFLELREKAGTTVVLVSHDRDEVRRVADRVTVLNRQVVRTGAATALEPGGWL